MSVHNLKWYKVEAKSEKHKKAAKLLEDLLNSEVQKESENLACRIGEKNPRLRKLYEDILADIKDEEST